MYTRRVSSFVAATQTRRMFATAATASMPRRSFGLKSAAKLGFGFAAGATFFTGAAVCWGAKPTPPPFDAAALRKDIEKLLDDDLSVAPSLVRLAWHEAGTFDKNKKDGSANDASMRFEPECKHAANAGLGKARAALEPIKAKHPNVSYADLWVLASIVAIEAMGGPKVTFRWGRKDAQSGAECPPDGRLPDATKNEDHVRDVFYRMGFNDTEIVALLGAHTIGECHAENSGFVGPWSHDKLGFDNSFFTHLLDEEWVLNKKAKKLQFADRATGKIMMLPTDVALIIDPKFREIVKKYAASQDAFHSDFAKAYQKLVELGTHDLHAL